MFRGRYSVTKGVKVIAKLQEGGHAQSFAQAISRDSDGIIRVRLDDEIVGEWLWGSPCETFAFLKDITISFRDA